MKFMEKLMNEQFAKTAARFMKLICNLAICFFILCMALTFMGRQTFFLHTGGKTYERAIYAEENHAPHSRGMTIQMGDDIHVWTNRDGGIDVTIQIGISLMYAIHAVPVIFAFWFLSRVFSNIQKGKIFIEQNAAYLLSYGLLQFVAAVFVPFVKVLISVLTNLVSDSRLSIATGQATFNMLVPSIAFMVAAYIVHYGVHLQDEVDHTV